MINKKILGLLSVTCLGASGGSLQANMPNFLNGFYVGANVGLQAMNGQHKVTSGNSQGPGNFPITDSQNTLGRGNYSLVGGVYAGYDYLFSHGYAAGLEITGQVDNAQSKLIRNEPAILSLQSKFIRDNMLGAALRFGKHCGDLFVYGRLGWETSRFKHRITQTVNSAPGGPLGSFSKHKQLNAFAPGIGLEKKIGPVWVRGDYIYSIYKTYKFNTGDPKVLGVMAANGKINPSFSTFKIGITYKFCSRS